MFTLEDNKLIILISNSLLLKTTIAFSIAIPFLIFLLQIPFEFLWSLVIFYGIMIYIYLRKPQSISVSEDYIHINKKNTTLFLSMNELVNIRLVHSHNKNSGGDIVTTLIEAIEDALEDNPKGNLDIELQGINKKYRFGIDQVRLDDVLPLRDQITKLVKKEPELSQGDEWQREQYIFSWIFSDKKIIETK